MKKLRFAFYLTGIAAALTAPAFAYIDASVGSLVFQAVAAAVVVAGAVVGTLWRKAKKKAMNALNIDENAGKTVEEDLVVFDQEAEASKEENAAE